MQIVADHAARSISISSFVHGRDAPLGYIIPASGFPERNRVLVERERRCGIGEASGKIVRAGIGAAAGSQASLFVVREPSELAETPALCHASKGENLKPLAIALLVLAFAELSCDQPTKPSAETQESPRREHHFDPIARSEGNLAVDTTTGQMCKTWEWGCVQGDTLYNPYTKRLQDRFSYGITCSAIRMMPTCETTARQQ